MVTGFDVGSHHQAEQDEDPSPRVGSLRDTSGGTLSGAPRHITSPHVFRHGAGDRCTCFADDFARLAAEREYRSGALTCNTASRCSSPGDPTTRAPSGSRP